MKAAVPLLLLLGCAALSGCGTLQCCCNDDPEAWPPYGGVALDVKEIEDTVPRMRLERDGQPPKVTYFGPPAWVTVAANACDVPLSAVADTLLLPVTVSYLVANRMSSAVHHGYENIRLGMTPREVEAVIGMPPGSYGKAVGGLVAAGKCVSEIGVARTRPPSDTGTSGDVPRYTDRRWVWGDGAVTVRFDAADRVVGYYLFEVR